MQVVNTLVASLFVHKMMVLPEIPTNIVKKMENLIRNFLWGGKKAKIAYKILQNPKNQGGLNLVDLRKRDIALKATWPKILHGEPEYETLVYSIMKCQTLKENIWRCNLKPEDVNSIGIENPFWVDVLQAWANYNYYHDFKIENQIIWHNSNILIGGKTVAWREAIQNGLLYVHQLFENMEVKKYAQVLEQYKIDQLRYNSLISAIPTEWKSFFQQTPKELFLPLAPHTFDSVIAKDNFNLSRKVYAYMAEDAMLLHNKFIKWRNDLGPEFDKTLYEFGQMHSDIYKFTNVPKYRSFQYRLMQRGLITNIQLQKWNIKQTNLCTFCNQEPETLTHLFHLCPKVMDLWGKIAEYIQNRYQMEVDLTNTTKIIFNAINGKKNHIVNFIALLTKQFIYRQRCLGNELHYPVLRAHIARTESLEKYIAIKNSKLVLHIRKWNPSEVNESVQLSDYIIEYMAQ